MGNPEPRSGLVVSGSRILSSRSESSVPLSIRALSPRLSTQPREKIKLFKGKKLNSSTHHSSLEATVREKKYKT